MMESAEGARSTWTHAITVEASDIDHMGHVNNSVHLRWLQSIMETHWRNFAPDGMFAKYVWIALRHEIDYRRAILPTDSVRAIMRVDWIRGARACVEAIFETQKGPSVSVRSVWCFIDAARQRPALIPAAVASVFGAAPE